MVLGLKLFAHVCAWWSGWLGMGMPSCLCERHAVLRGGGDVAVFSNGGGVCRGQGVCDHGQGPQRWPSREVGIASVLLVCVRLCC